MNRFRVYHAVFGLAVIAAYFTGESLGLIHAWVGYGIAALLMLRIALGLGGQRGFEFRRLKPSFAPPPPGQTGMRHPAIARLTMLALFISVIGSGVTGVVMDKGGTLVGQSIRAHDEDHERERDEARAGAMAAPGGAEPREHGEGDEKHSLIETVHKTLGSLLLPLVLIHAIYLLVFRFDLARFILFFPRRRTPA